MLKATLSVAILLGSSLVFPARSPQTALPERFVHRESGIAFILIPAGRFQMGSWIRSVQGAVATWSAISKHYFLTIFDSHGLTRSLPLPVLTRSKCDSYF